MLTAGDYRRLLKGVPTDWYLWRDRDTILNGAVLQVLLNDGTKTTVTKTTVKLGMDCSGNGWDYGQVYTDPKGKEINPAHIKAYKRS